MQSKDNLKLMETLVESLQRIGVIRSSLVAKAMASVDRGEFCKQGHPYADCPQSIGYNATISAPHMHAYALEFLAEKLPNAEKVLDVGSGSGFLMAAFYRMMQNPNAKVYGIEHIPELCKESEVNLKKSFSKELEQGKLVVVEGDGREGLPQFGPYDCIHVGAAAPELPKALLEQLKNGGRMLIPVGIYEQSFQVIDKDENGKVSIQDVLGVRYVPLTSRKQQWKY